MMNPVPWLQMTNMISYQGLVRTFPNCQHVGFVTGGNLDLLDHKAFNWVNTMIGNVKNSLRGSCHKLGAKHLPRHLAEYCFRFNHRFDLKSMMVQLGHAVVASPAIPYRLLKMAEGHG